MKKIIVFSLLIVSMLIAMGCEGIDVSQLSDEDLARIAEQAIVCNEPYMRFETGCCLDQNSDGICDTGEVVIPENSDTCVPHECVYQAYAGGVKECGIIDDGCDGTINCNYQAYAGGLECPPGNECVNNNCVETEECIPRECVYQAYAGGVKECGVLDDGCGGTINCNYQAYAGGLECPTDLECVDNQCEEQCVPKTKDDCIRQDYAGGIYQCGEIDDGCGGTVNCNYQAYAGGLECPDGLSCVDNSCTSGDESPPEVILGGTYSISAYAIQGQDDQGDFTINDEHFVLTVGGDNHNLPNGGIVGIDNTLIQDYAGGLKGVDFDMVSVCTSDYALQAYYDGTPGVDAKFIVVSISTKLRPISQEETFNLNVGETKTLRDGATITLQDTLTQGYAGGLHGVVFDLIC